MALCLIDCVAAAKNPPVFTMVVALANVNQDCKHHVAAIIKREKKRRLN
ncbi:hypothetical protein COLO4_26585 [Corchorus olitorius]|uniref:Uncharacterized protein n=1 Tax=Corchorus olitorius TaxID=93759 RepID=A0A1R3HWG3_9ROSI|nr:hypothetical protein COLO4_26585 [Corchorus olitorius]